MLHNGRMAELVDAGDLKSPDHRLCGFESRSGYKHADVAQLAEQLICNQQVGSSSLPVSSTLSRRRHGVLGNVAYCANCQLAI